MYKITLEQEDFLRFQLFAASQSKRIRFKRIRTWILLTVSFFVLGLVLTQHEDRFLSINFMLIALITLVFYPFYQRWLYKRHYKRHIKDNYKNKFGVECTLEFVDGYLINKADSQEIKIGLSQIEEIVEIPGNMFIKIKTGEGVIIPSRFSGFSKLKNELQELTASMDVNWTEKMNWKWK